MATNEERIEKVEFKMLEPRDDIADIRLESQLTREWIAQLEGKMKDVLESVVDICHALE